MITGSVMGLNHSALIHEAESIAATYYGTDCVYVELANEGVWSIDRTLTEITLTREFSADFIAQVHHDLRPVVRGPNECSRCGEKSWPHDPLPQRERNEANND